MSPTELREHCQKWEAIASSTKPADRKRVERSFKEIYTDLLKKGEPPPFFWAISPRDVRKITKPLYVTEGEKRYGTDFKTPGQIRRVVQAAIGKLPREPELEAAVNQIRHPLDLGRRRSWRLWSERPDIGEHSDIRREAFVDFFFSCGEWKGMLQSWLFVVASCNGLYMLERGIVFLDTPEIIRTDENGQLHCENGPAFRYRDGTEYHFLHGIRVPKQYVLAGPDEISLTDVLTERNAEVRMALISKIGFMQLLGSVRHWTISEANGNRLLEFRVKGTQFLRALHLKWHDKTGDKETVIPVPHRRSYFGNDVPDDIDDCEQVRRWTLGWPKEALAIAET